MSEEVEDGTEVLRVTIYQECSALILEGLIVMWFQYVNWKYVVQTKDYKFKWYSVDYYARGNALSLGKNLSHDSATGGGASFNNYYIQS